MPIGVDRDLDGTVTHQFFYVGKRSAGLYQQTSESVPKIMKAESPEPRVLQNRLELLMNQVVRVENRPHPRGKD